MDYVTPDFDYEFYAKEMNWRYKNYTDQAVQELRQQIGPNPGVQIKIEPVKKGSNLHSVAMTITGYDDPIFIKKVGKEIGATINKVKKVALNKVRRCHKKKLDKKRHQKFNKEAAAS